MPDFISMTNNESLNGQGCNFLLNIFMPEILQIINKGDGAGKQVS